MKCRGGFVSNSSSSSFIIGIKDIELTQQTLLNAFKIPTDSPLYKFAKDMAAYMSSGESIDEEQFMDEQCDGWETLEDAINDGSKIASMLHDGYRVYRISASSESDSPLEMMMYFGGLDDFNSEGIILKQEY